MRLRPLTFALLLACLPLAAAAPVEDQAWRLDRREVSAAALPDAALLTSRRSSEAGDDELTARLDAGAARLDVRLVAVRPDAAAAGLSLRWDSLVEYRDADGDGHYSLSDPAVQRVSIPALPHGIVVAPLVAGGQSATATYSLARNGTDPFPIPGTSGTLALAIALVPSPTTLEGQAVDPTQVHLSASVRGFPYAQDGTALALVGEASSEGPVGAHGGAVGRTALPLEVEARWQGVALADGANRPAPTAATTLGGGAAGVVQSWPRGDDVSQDGAVTVQRWSDVAAALGELAGDWRFYALGVAAVGVAFGVPSWRRVRRA
jgi:hypothetical protein